MNNLQSSTVSKRFKQGDMILLLAKTGQKYRVKLNDQKFHCDFGVIDLTKLVNKAPGYRFTTDFGYEIIIVSPSLDDGIKLKHTSQIIYTKDAALIAFLVNAVAGSTIYEAGTGSGALTSILAKFVGPTGRIITHESRKEALDIAKKNILKQGLENIRFHHTNVRSGFCPGNADGVILDLGDPWEVIPESTKVLVPGRRIVIFLPTYNQIERTIKSLKQNDFIEIEGREFWERKFELKENALRPQTRMIGHTGFILSARFIGNKKNET